MDYTMKELIEEAARKTGESLNPQFYSQFDHIKNWSVWDLMSWGKVCFPKASVSDQTDRVLEELKEYKENNSITEIADSIIAAINVGRFSIVMMVKLFLLIEDRTGVKSIDNEALSQAINDKMKINLQRWKDGEWKWDEATQQYKR